jgi:hypothetical protein
LNSPWIAKNLELVKELDAATFRLLTQQQLVKDFEKCGLPYSNDFSEKIYSLEEIFSYTADLLSLSMEKGERHLLQLLYSIDLPEKNFLALVGTKNLLIDLAQQVVFREAYKVWLRKTYS